MFAIKIYPRRNLALLLVDDTGTWVESGFIAFTNFKIWGISDNLVTFYLPSIRDGDMITSTICADRVSICN